MYVNIAVKDSDGEKSQPTFKQLKEAAQPLIELLNRYYDPMCCAVVESGFVKIVREEIGTPLEVKD